MTLLEAVAACTLRPARLLGLEAVLGTLRPGARADLVVLGEQGDLRQTWIGGRCVHRAAGER
jgi:N-acetylglucosamine-6-phosphate deacetylase